MQLFTHALGFEKLSKYEREHLHEADQRYRGCSSYGRHENYFPCHEPVHGTNGMALPVHQPVFFRKWYGRHGPEYCEHILLRLDGESWESDDHVENQINGELLGYL